MQSTVKLLHPAPFKEALQNRLCGHLVKHGLLFTTVQAGLVEELGSVERSEPLVGPIDGQAEAAVKSVAEFAGQAGHFVFAAVGGKRQPHHELHRPPFGHQGGDGGEFFVVALAADGGQRVGNAHFGIALCHADAGFAKIEGQRSAVWDIKHGRRFE